MSNIINLIAKSINEAEEPDESEGVLSSLGKEKTAKQMAYDSERDARKKELDFALERSKETGSFKPLLDVSREIGISGLETLDLFEQVNNLMGVAKKQYNKLKEAGRGDESSVKEIFVKLVYENNRLSHYSLDREAAKQYGVSNPFKINYPTRRATMLRDLYRDLKKVRNEVQKATDLIAKQPKIAQKRGVTPEILTRHYETIDDLESRIEPVETEYDNEIKTSVNQYLSRVKDLKAKVYTKLDALVNQLFEDAWPEDWRTSPRSRVGKVKLSPFEQEDPEETPDTWSSLLKHSIKGDYSADYSDESIYLVRLNNSDEVVSMPYDEAMAIAKAGEGTIYRPEHEESENPDQPEDRGQGIDLGTENFDELGLDHVKKNVDDYLESVGYDPEEEVVVTYTIGGKRIEGSTTRQAVAEKNILNHPEVEDPRIFPVDGTIVALHKESGRPYKLTYDKYNYYANIIIDSKEIPPEDWNRTQRAVNLYILPFSETGQPLTQEEVDDFNYNPVDQNGGELKKLTWVGIDGTEKEYPDSSISVGNNYIEDIRDDNYNNYALFDSRGKIRRAIIYNRDLDVKTGLAKKVPDNVIKLRFPPSPPSFKEQFGKARPTSIKMGWNGPYFVAKRIPWAQETDDGWKLGYLENVPFDRALILISDLWRNYMLKDQYTTTRTGSKILREPIKSWLDPNGIRLTTYKGKTIKLIDLLNKIRPKKGERPGDLGTMKCTQDKVSPTTSELVDCNNPARHTSEPMEVALISQKGDNVDWKMVNPEEATARHEILKLDNGVESSINRDELERKIGELSGRTDAITLTRHGAMCDSCWQNRFNLMPNNIIEVMQVELENVKDIVDNFLINAQSDDEQNWAHHEIINRLNSWAKRYMVNGGFFKTIIDYVQDANIAPNIQDNIVISINRFYENLLEGLYKLYDPKYSDSLFDPDTLNPENNVHILNIYISAIQRQLANMSIWSDSIRRSAYDKKNIFGSSVDPDHYIIPFSKIDRPDVRNARALSRALQNVEKKSFGRPKDINFENYHRVRINGLIGEESAFNGLYGNVIKEGHDMVIVKLDHSPSINESIIKLYPGEIETVWDNKTPNPIDHHKDYVRDQRAKKEQSDSMIKIIGDATYEHSFL